MTRDELIEHLKENTRVLRTPELEAAFRAVPRADFVPEDYKIEAYEDYPLPIGFGQTISQPTTVAFMLELLGIRKGDRVLDVGSGSGWTTALLSKLVGEKGEVTGVEVIPELVAMGRKNLAHYDSSNAKIVEADSEGRRPEPGAYDRILVSAAAEREVPEELLRALKVGGIMVIPIGHSILRIEKTEENGEEKIETKEFPGFAFVPLK